MTTHAASTTEADAFYHEAFNRNIGILTPDDQTRLRRATIAVVGCGGVGGAHIINAARIGVGNLSIADMDTFDTANIQRQYGAFTDTIGRNKAQTMAAIAQSINPHLVVKVFPNGVDEAIIDQFLNKADVLIDGIDFFCIDMRRRLFMRAREKGIPAVTAGPMGFGCALLVFTPDGMSFDEYFDITDAMSYLDKLAAFAVGLAPAALHIRYLDLKKVDLAAKTGPALVTSCALSSSLAITEAVRLITGTGRTLGAPYYLQFDPWLRQFTQGRLWMANRHPWQQLKRFIIKRKVESQHRGQQRKEGAA